MLKLRRDITLGYLFGAKLLFIGVSKVVSNLRLDINVGQLVGANLCPQSGVKSCVRTSKVVSRHKKLCPDIKKLCSKT